MRGQTDSRNLLLTTFMIFSRPVPLKGGKQNENEKCEEKGQETT